MRRPKLIRLFWGIEYFEGQSESDISNYIQEGWYFISRTYEFKEGVNLSKNFSREVSVIAKELNNQRKVKNKAFVLRLLKKRNDKQLELLCAQASYWESESSLSSRLTPQVENRINFCLTILYDFKHWYEKNNFFIPENCYHPILKSVSSDIARKIGVKKKVLSKESDEFNIDQIDQDTLIEKFQKECEKKKLTKGKTVPNDTLYDIAKEVEINVGEFDTFKSGDKAYHLAREFASRLGYKRKKLSER